MKLKILHLSDFHFKNNNMTQDIVMSSLLKKIEEIGNSDTKPNTLIITGDISYSGKHEEFKIALEFINKICSKCEIDIKNVFIIPGNHDVDRSKVDPSHLDWWYNFDDETKLSAVLNSDLARTAILSKTNEYFEFIKNFMTGKVELGIYGEFVATIPIDDEGQVVKIIGLNSSIFCGYDKDDQKKLALGLGQVDNCLNKVNPDHEIVITCIHHPFECFHSCDSPSLSVVSRISDIILSGHVHNPSNTFTRGGITGNTVFLTSGAAYEKRTTQNGFNILNIDTQTLKGEVEIYKYLPSDHIWIPNKDINPEQNGFFDFEITKKKNFIDSKKLDGKTENLISNLHSYVIILNGSFEKLDRNQYVEFERNLKQIFNDINGQIIKIEMGSIKVTFNTTSELTSEVLEKLTNNVQFEIIDINELKPKTLVNEVNQILHWKAKIKHDFLNVILNPGATFTHQRADEELCLEDIFVSPNLKIISLGENAKERIEKVVNADSVFEKSSENPIKVVLYGSDNSGKSTLVRWWFKKYFERGDLPILLDGNLIKDISIERIKKLVYAQLNLQYDLPLNNGIEDFDFNKLILFIDDFHKIRFTKSKFKTNLISNLDQTFPNLIITGNDVMQFESYSSKSGGNVLEDFHKYQIMEFGPRLRFELIKKWNAIGIEQLEPNELIRLNNETESHVESIIGKNFVPSFPLYILTILQARDATSSQNPEFSIHGFYYELLINDSLNHGVKVKGDISLYYNFITEYCYFLFDSKIRLSPLFLDDFIKFHTNYCLEYKIEISPKVLIETLVNSKLIKIDIDTISITYKYVYYFFVARYMANNISQPIIKSKVELLCQRVHRDEFASIVMFLTHLTKDQFVLNQLLVNSKELFKGYAPLKLEEDVTFINNLILKLPEQVYLPIDVEKMKEEELKEKEELVLQEQEFEADKDVFEYDLEEDVNTLDDLSNMIKAIKSIEILGQVTKKYWGELKAQQKYELAEETYMLGLRTLGFYFKLVSSDPEMLIEYLNHIYKKKHLNKNFSKEEVDKASRNFLFGLCALSTFGIIKRITNAVGYEKLAGTFSDLLANYSFNSVKLIDTSIRLDHNKSFPWENIKELKPETDRNYLASIVLKNLVINYLYVYVTTEADKQKICELLSIKMEQLRLIDGTSTIKKETIKYN